MLCYVTCAEYTEIVQLFTGKLFRVTYVGQEWCSHDVA